MIIGTDDMSLKGYLTEFFLAPLNYPEVLKASLPLILGSIILATFFGRENKSKFGRADSIGNSVLWLTTGLGLYLSYDLQYRELLVVLSITLFGVFTLYLDLTETVPDYLAFLTGLVGPANGLAYLSIVLVLTPLQANWKSTKAAIIFIGVVGLFFKILRHEMPSKGGIT